METQDRKQRMERFINNEIEITAYLIWLELGKPEKKDTEIWEMAKKRTFWSKIKVYSFIVLEDSRPNQ